MTYQKRYEKIVRLRMATGDPGEYFGKLADLCQEVIIELEKSDKAIAGLGKLIEQKDAAVRRTT